MRTPVLLVVLLPAIVTAAPQGTAAPADRDARADRVQKRLRVAKAIGLAEALDLDDAAALRVRDILARYDEKRAPLREQARAAVRIVRDAAHGDQAAAGQVDASLQRARDARAKLQQLDAQMLDEIAKGLTAERKARAALFLAAFRHRAQRFAAFGGGHRMRGPGFGGHPGAPGMGGPGRGPHAEEGLPPGRDDSGEPGAVSMGELGDDLDDAL
jgi:hypothetical protein